MDHLFNGTLSRYCIKEILLVFFYLLAQIGKTLNTEAIYVIDSVSTTWRAELNQHRWARGPALGSG
jgi:hypothetical protein